MITIETAQRLRAAGFPQGHYQDIFNEVAQHPEMEKIYAQTYGVKSLGDIAYQPNLSELIEACGDGFNDLYKDYEGCYRTNRLEVFDDISYKTPDEAVANLYIALNRTVS